MISYEKAKAALMSKGSINGTPIIGASEALKLMRAGHVVVRCCWNSSSDLYRISNGMIMYWSQINKIWKTLTPNIAYFTDGRQRQPFFLLTHQSYQHIDPDIRHNDIEALMREKEYGKFV
jgi:hypothetical protein